MEGKRGTGFGGPPSGDRQRAADFGPLRPTGGRLCAPARAYVPHGACAAGTPSCSAYASSDHDMLSRASSADDAAGPNVPAV